MLALSTNKLTKLSLIGLFVLLSACSSFKKYPQTDNPNFSLKVDELYTGGAIGSLFTDSYVDLHIHINPAKTSKKAKCVPTQDRWYVGSIIELKANKSKSIRLPIGQRAYLVAKQVTSSWSGNTKNESVNITTFDLVPKKGEKYEFSYKQSEIAVGSSLHAIKAGKKRQINANKWVDC